MLWWRIVGTRSPPGVLHSLSYISGFLPSWIKKETTSLWTRCLTMLTIFCWTWVERRYDFLKYSTCRTSSYKHNCIISLIVDSLRGALQWCILPFWDSPTRWQHIGYVSGQPHSALSTDVMSIHCILMNLLPCSDFVHTACVLILTMFCCLHYDSKGITMIISFMIYAM